MSNKFTCITKITEDFKYTDAVFQKRYTAISTKTWHRCLEELNFHWEV